MGLTAVFQKGALTAFNAAGDLVKAGVYRKITDDGFDTTTTTDYDCRVIPVVDWDKEQNPYNFTEVIQPNDVIALILGYGLTVEIEIREQLIFNDTTYTIVDKKVDPATAVYILLLRTI